MEEYLKEIIAETEELKKKLDESRKALFIQFVEQLDEVIEGEGWAEEMKKELEEKGLPYMIRFSEDFISQDLANILSSSIGIIVYLDNALAKDCFFVQWENPFESNSIALLGIFPNDKILGYHPYMVHF